MKHLTAILIAITLTACGGGDHEEEENAAKPAEQPGHQIVPIDCSTNACK
jgi:hypothetical protein